MKFKNFWLYRNHLIKKYYIFSVFKISTLLFIFFKVDHFSYGNTDVFKQRILINSDYYMPYGPVFFYTGNEGDITWFCNNTVCFLLLLN